MKLPFSKPKRKDPPTRTSSLLTVMLIPFGLNQDCNAAGSIQAWKTRWREAENVRRSTRVVLLYKRYTSIDCAENGTIGMDGWRISEAFSSIDANRMEKSRMVPAPFQIQVSEEVLMDLRQRLARTRWPDSLPDAGWDYGTNLSYLRQLVDYWLESYDWRAQERFLNAFPQFTTEIDGIHLHFLHVKGKGTHPIPLLISHGWPGCFFEMYKIIGPLTDPASHGGDPADAFDVVVP